MLFGMACLAVSMDEIFSGWKEGSCDVGLPSDTLSEDVRSFNKFCKINRQFERRFNKKFFPDGPDLKQLLSKMLTLDPDKRITAQEVLQHKWCKRTDRFCNSTYANDWDIPPTDTEGTMPLEEEPPAVPATNTTATTGAAGGIGVSILPLPPGDSVASVA